MDGNTIREIRAGLNESQEAFAKRFGYTRDAIAKWESNIRKPRGLSLKYLERLKKKIGLI